MASIKRRDGGKWQAQVRRKGHTARTKTFQKKSDAEAWVRQLESDLDVGIQVLSRKAEITTFGECLERYRREVTPGKRGRAQESSKIGVLLKHPLALRFMPTIRGTDLAAYRDERINVDQMKPATALRELALISHVFNTAQQEWGMEALENPVARMRKPKVNDGRDRLVLTAAMKLDSKERRVVDEIEAIKQFSDSPALPIVLDLAIDTAMRRGEIAALRWEDIFEADGYITCRRTHTKNQSPRSVPVSDNMMQTLMAMPTRQRLGWVFGNRADAFTRAFNRAMERARAAYEDQVDDAAGDPFLVDLRFHDLRHEATTRLAKLYEVHELAKVTGHKRMDLILRYYHPTGKDLATKRRIAEERHHDIVCEPTN